MLTVKVEIGENELLHIIAVSLEQLAKETRRGHASVDHMRMVLKTNLLRADQVLELREKYPHR